MIIFTSFITMVICFVRITPTLPIHRLSASKDINFNDRKYAYVVWKLSDDSEHLKLRSVKGDVIPKEKKNSTAVAKFWRRTRTILICSVKRSNSTKKRDRRFA